MSRSDCIRYATIALALAVYGNPLPAGERSPKNARPNILLIITDQQHADMMSCTGDRWLKTPAVDGLARDGIRFETAYCANPVCVPSRTAMATGVMPCRLGAGNNGPGMKIQELPTEIDENSLGKIVRRAGYETFYGGKVHMCNALAPKNAGYDVVFRDSRDQLPGACLKFIKQKRAKPFFAVASFINPHDICFAHLARNDQDRAGVLKLYQEAVDLPLDRLPPLPENDAIPLKEPAAIPGHLSPLAVTPAITMRGQYDERDWRIYRWIYRRVTEKVDRQIGSLLDGLKDAGLEENTLIIFTSDHGNMDASHRLASKGLLYDESVRVPLIMKYKGVIPPDRTDKEHLISTGLDLLPTICDYTGTAVPEHLLGGSLRPLAEGKAVDRWRSYVAAENDWSRMIRTRRFKYCVYDSPEREESLVDMENDPGEMANLADDPRFRDELRKHRELFADWTKLSEDKEAAKFVVKEKARTRPKEQRPNIIFLMDDQHRWDALGIVDPAVKTPHLDALAESGIFFDQTVCQTPMCVPSRNSMMLGVYPNQSGILRNGYRGLPDDRLPTLPLAEHFRRAGYQTAGFGKTHWGVVCSTRGFETRYVAECLEKGAIMMKDDAPEAKRRYDAESRTMGGGEENNLGYLGFTSPLPEHEHRDGWVTGKCLDFIDSGIDPERPLFLYLSFLKPHAGHNVPAGFEDRYDVDSVEYARQPPWPQDRSLHAAGVNRREMYIDYWSRATDEQWRLMTMRYRANCTWIDDMFGRVLAELKRKGLLDNALIVYCSDHGEMLGERYYRFNKYCLYESSVRVPLILSGSAVAESLRGTIDRRPAELVDLYPTLLRAAGIKVPRRAVGLDLLGEGKRPASFSALHERKDEAAFMWRTARAKLILVMRRRTDNDASKYTADDILDGEFYDLTEDPQEWNDLYGSTADDTRRIRETMTSQLLEFLENRTALLK